MDQLTESSNTRGVAFGSSRPSPVEDRHPLPVCCAIEKSAFLAHEAILVEDNLNQCLPENLSHPRHDIVLACLSERKSKVL